MNEKEEKELIVFMAETKSILTAIKEYMADNSKKIIHLSEQLNRQGRIFAVQNERFKTLESYVGTTRKLIIGAVITVITAGICSLFF